MEPKVILVDLFDNAIGESEKTIAHQTPQLHRAFSVFIYHGSKMLIQRRATDKYHCGGLWANTCCSHPRPNENTADAAKRRLFEETGISHSDLRELFSFSYFYAFDNGLYEYEYDHVLVGEYNGNSNHDTKEIEQLLWLDVKQLMTDMQCNPQKYAPWFLICAPKVVKYILERE
ncbi:MAG: isopentenyl-diphosphate Delta-isomerase [Oscillospiraceae bacterium]